jgi:hypothetical protein
LLSDSRRVAGLIVGRLLERDEELRQLAALARRLGRDPGRVVLMRGEAGVGKTAVISELVAGVEPSVRVLQGWCDPLATPRPLGPLIDALAGLDRRVADGLVGARAISFSSARLGPRVPRLPGCPATTKLPPRRPSAHWQWPDRGPIPG